MNIQLTLAARYLAGRKLRTFLTTLAVIFGVLVIFGMNIVLPTMMQALQANVQGGSGVVDFSITHVSGGVFPAGVEQGIRTVDGVRAVSASLRRTINLPADFVDHDPARLDVLKAVTLIGVEPEDARSVRTFPVTAGRYLEPGDAASAVISQTLADAFSVKMGESFPLPTTLGVVNLTVVGILPPRIDPGNEEVFVTLLQAQNMTGEPGRINTIDVNIADAFANESRRAEIQRGIEAVTGADYHVGTLMSGSEMFAAMELGQVSLNLFGMLALFMGAFIIFNTFRTVVVERRRDIGLLRALGANRRTIIGIILAESLLQGILGTLVGLFLGYWLGVLILKVAEGPLTSFINLKLGAPVVSSWLVTYSAAMGIGVTVLAGLVPAMRASSVTPLEALRPSAAEMEFKRETGRGAVFGGVIIVGTLLALFSGNPAFIIPGGFLFLFGLVLAAPVLVNPFAQVFGRLADLLFAQQGIGGLAHGNLTRQPSRVAITASATMLGLTVVVAAGGLVSSLTGTLFDVMHQNLGSDYLFVPPSVAIWGSNLGADASLASDLRALDGVEQVSTMRFASTVSGGMAVSVMGIDPVAFPQVSGLYFQENMLAGEQAAYEMLEGERAMIANGAFMLSLGKKLGDPVDFSTPHGKVTYRIVAVASDLLNAKVTTAFISQANLLADFGASEDIFLQLNLSPGADAAALDEQIRALAYDYPQFRVIAGKAYYESLKSQMDAAFSAMYLLFAILAFPSLIAMLNTLAIGVIERTREIGMIRAVGGTRTQVHRMVVAEALILAAIGTAFGILGGLYLGYVFTLAMSPIFPMGYAFPLAGILVAVAFGLLFGALAAILPARQAAQLDVVSALRYE